MWARHLLDPSQNGGAGADAGDGRLGAMGAKALLMLVLYFITAFLLWRLLSQLGWHSRRWGGFGILALLYICHLDAASWLFRFNIPGRFLSLSTQVWIFLRGKSWIVWGMALSAFAAGMLGWIDSGAGKEGLALAAAKGAGLCVCGGSLCSLCLGLLSPSLLGALEGASASKMGRFSAAFHRTWPKAVGSWALWFCFSWLAGY